MRLRVVATFEDMQIALESWHTVELYMPDATTGDYIGEVIGTCYNNGEPAANVKKTDGATSVYNFNNPNTLNPEKRTFYEVF